MKFINFFSHKSIRSSSTIAAVGLTLMIIYIDRQISIDAGTVYLQLAYTASDFKSILAVWGQGGADYYLKTLWIDFAYAVSYAFMLTSAIIFFLRKKHSISPETAEGHMKFMIYLPLVAVFFDFCENIFHIYLLTSSITSSAVMTSFIMSILKWTLLTVSLCYFLFLYFGYRKEK